MPTAQHAIRIDPALLEAAGPKAEEQRLRTVSEIVRQALREYAGGDGCPRCRAADGRARVLEAELARVKAELAAYQAEAAKAETMAYRDAVLADLIRDATPEDPVSPARVVAVTGLLERQVFRIFERLVAAGYVTRLKRGCYVAAPGMDASDGLNAIAGQRGGQQPVTGPGPVAEATGPAEAQAAAAKGETPRTARTQRPPARKRPPANTRPPVAAKDRQAAIAELRERGDLVTASELPAATFKAGPGVDCAHEDMRIRKGVCPACKQWVTR